MLASADLPSSVTSIGDRAFAGCSTLGHGMFMECYELKSVWLPATLREIEGQAFQNCRKLESISFEYDNPIEVSVHVRTATARFFTSKFVIEVVYSLEDDEVADVTGKVWKKK